MTMIASVSRCAVLFTVVILAIDGVAQGVGQNDKPSLAAPEKGNERTVLIGNGVSPPRVLYNPEPAYSDEARRALITGQVLLTLVVGPDGQARDIKVVAPLGNGLDEKAIEAVKTWKFDPAMKAGKPVAVQIMIEVDFALLRSGVGKVDLVSDPPGANLNSYLSAVIAQTETCWTEPKSDATPVPSIKQGQVTIQFAIRKDGRVGVTEIALPSGDEVLDGHARDCISRLKVTKPLPAEFKSKELVVRIQLLYNVRGAAIAPDHAQIAAGHTKQFYMEVAGIVSRVSDWSITGTDCTGAACGTISPDGLYTAPDVLPQPPYVRVKGMLAGANPLAGSAVVTLVKAR